MISVVCVFNNVQVLNRVLLPSLKKQTTPYELILIDNCFQKFSSAAAALNSVGTSYKGDYLMFIHQDMMLGYDRWLFDVEQTLKTLPDIGIAGVAGMSDRELTWQERLKFSITQLDENEFSLAGKIIEPGEVHTLDECLLVIPRSVFSKIKFDEQTFDAWDCYGADYCLKVWDVGFKAYVIPQNSSHCNARAKLKLWEFKNLIKYQKLLYKKHRIRHKTIFTFLGDLDWKYFFHIRIQKMIRPILNLLFPHFTKILNKKLRGCDTIVDLGCGHFSPLYAAKKKFSVGVDINPQSVLESKMIAIHDEYILGNITDIHFKDSSVEAIIMIDVLDKLTHEDGLRLLTKIEKWATKKIILKIPNGVVNINQTLINPYNKQQSSWEINFFKERGYKVYGINGWKGTSLKIRNLNSLYFNFLSEQLDNLTRYFVYFVPKFANELLIIKHKVPVSQKDH